MKIQYFLIIVFVGVFIKQSHADFLIADRQDQMREMEYVLEKTVNIDTESITGLDDYIRVGLRQNAGLKSAFYQWKASLKKIPQVFSLPDPQFSYTDYVREVETRVGPQNRAFSFKQKFPLPDKLWIRKHKAFKASEAAYYRLEKQRFDLAYQIANSYYEYAYLAKAILLTEENMKLLKNFESVAQTKYASGIAKNQDLLKVQVELGKLESDLYSLKDLRVSLVARLNSLLNFPKSTMLPWPDEMLEGVKLSEEYYEVEKLVNRLKEKSPQLRTLVEKVHVEEQNLKLSKREFFPDLTVGVTHIDTADARNSSTADSGKDPLMVMFSVNVPIWFGRLKAGIDEAQASLEAAEYFELEKTNELSSRLALIHYKLRDALRQSGLYETALISKATQTLNATKSGYEAGNVDFLSLIDAQRMLLNFQRAYYRHNANFNQRLVELQSLLGEIDISTQDGL